MDTLPGPGEPADRPDPHQLQSDRRRDRTAQLVGAQPPEHSRPHTARARRSAAASCPGRLERSWWPTTPRSSCASWRTCPAIPAFIDAFRQGGDIHRQTAAIIFNVPVAEVTPEMRARAKTINFATIYGQGAFSLSRQLGITQEEAKAFIARYFERFAGVRAFLDRQVQLARSRDTSRRSSTGAATSPRSGTRNFNMRAYGERTGSELTPPGLGGRPHQDRHDPHPRGHPAARASPAACSSRCTTSWCFEVPPGRGRNHDGSGRAPYGDRRRSFRCPWWWISGSGPTGWTPSGEEPWPSGFVCSEPGVGDLAFVDVDAILDALEAALVSARHALVRCRPAELATLGHAPGSARRLGIAGTLSAAGFPGHGASALAAIVREVGSDDEDRAVRRSAYARVRGAAQFESAARCSDHAAAVCWRRPSPAALLVLAFMGWIVVAFAIKLNAIAGAVFAANATPLIRPQGIRCSDDLRGIRLTPGHQFHRPIACMNAGTSTIRMIVASSRTATASPKPSELHRQHPGEREDAEHQDHDQRRRGDDRGRGAQALHGGLGVPPGLVERLLDPGQQEHLVVHAEPEHHREDQHRHRPRRWPMWARRARTAAIPRRAGTPAR